MENSSSKPNNVSAESKAKETIERRLREAGVSAERSASVKDGTKKCYDHDDRRSPTEVPGNFTIHGGDGLVILDIDAPIKELPDWVADLPETFFVESPHGGYHVYYVVADDSGISNTKTDWGSIRYGWYGVGSGSIIDHSQCPDNKDGCPGEGVGAYKIGVDKPIATLSGEELVSLREVCDSSDDSIGRAEEYGGDKITLPDDTIADEGERFICVEFAQQATELAGADLMDFLRGGTGSYELPRDGNPEKINQSAADYYVLDMLYGAFLYRGEDEEDARSLTLSVFKRYCREKPYDKTGTLRKWLRKGESYLDEQMDDVQQSFDFDKWHRWRRRKYEGGYDPDEHRPWSDPATDGKRSDITKDTVRATLHILSGDRDPEYVARQFGLALSTPSPLCGEMCTPPKSETEAGVSHRPTSREVGKVAHELNPKRAASYFEETVRALSRETSEIAHAYCPSRPNGERHVYYPGSLPDPEDARWVRVNGVEYDPDVADGVNSWTRDPVMKDSEDEAESEQELRTDGGEETERSEAEQDLERIRRARENDDRSTDPPQVFTCPIEGCDRTVIGNPGDIRNHVRQSEDVAHQHRTLDEDLEVVVHWERMDWGPGAPKIIEI